MCLMNVKRSCGHIEQVVISMMMRHQIELKKIEEETKLCRDCREVDMVIDFASEAMLKAEQLCNLAYVLEPSADEVELKL